MSTRCQVVSVTAEEVATRTCIIHRLRGESGPCMYRTHSEERKDEAHICETLHCQKCEAMLLSIRDGGQIETVTQVRALDHGKRPNWVKRKPI